MKTWLVSVSVSVVAAFISCVVQAAGDAAAGEVIANQGIPSQKVLPCMGCHGPAGNALNPMWPKLAGQHGQYIYKQLMDFHGGARVNEQMSPNAKGLKEGDMLNLAAYYSDQAQTPGTADPALAELGERVYRGGNPATGVPACAGCHGPTGMGMAAAKFPRIAGQHAAYLDSTLKGFRAATRSNDPNGMMRGVAGRMSDQEIAAVSQFLQGLAQ
jgi:cytochrome c553